MKTLGLAVLSFICACGFIQAGYSQSAPGPTVRGKFIDNEGKDIPWEKIAGAMITLSEINPYPSPSHFSFAGTFPARDGTFEINSAPNDSVLLKADPLGYLPVEMMVARDSEVYLLLEEEADWYIGPGVRPRPVITGHIFDKKGNSISGVHISTWEYDDGKEIATTTANDGSFEIMPMTREDVTLVLSIEGRKPLRIIVPPLGGEPPKPNRSSLIKRDGLFIVLQRERN